MCCSLQVSELDFPAIVICGLGLIDDVMGKVYSAMINQVPSFSFKNSTI